MVQKAKESTVPKEVVKEWPQDGHPMTGDPFTRCEFFNSEMPVNVMFHGPPVPPERRVYEWDDWTDQEVYVRDLTDEEYDQAWKDYEKAAKKWHTTQGRILVPGLTTVKGKFLTDCGDWAEGELMGDNQWLWIQWGVCLGGQG